MRRVKWGITLCLMITMLTMKTDVYAAELEMPEMVPMRATAYCINGTTATGKKTRIGIAASSKNRLGLTALIYQRLPGDQCGDLIGIYEIEDTGGTDGLQSGSVIDCWYPDLDACQEFMNRVYEDGCQGKVFVQFVDAKG